MNFFKNHKKLSVWLSAFIFVAAVIIFKELLTSLPSVFNFIGRILSILSPFIAGFVIAFILYVPCRKFESLLEKLRRPKFIAKHARGISVLTVYITFVALIVVALVLIIPWLVKNIIKLYNNSDVYYTTVVNFINSYCDAEGKLFGLFNINELVEMVNPSRLLSNLNMDKLASIASGVYKVGSAVVEIVLAIFSSVYMLISRKSLVRSAGHFLTLFTSKKNVLKVHDYLLKIADIFYTYIYSTLLDAMVVGITCSIAFIIIGIDYAPLFGFAIGFANLIPYFGAIIAGVFVALFTAITEGFVTALIVAACILVIQQIDANILQPRIIGKSVGIQPLLTLVAITVGGGLLGFWGVLLGVPLAATMQMILIDILNAHDKAVIAAQVDNESSQSQDEDIT
ncbi:MAG: AI-2E family transporter [Ruminococcaceae bacterium]|nr:AI-2E family transporter [Oscillospiraceae bacterium]